jgi:phosphatidate cytidylyltransferase
MSDMGPAGPEPASPHAVPEEGITVTGSNPEMPHWSDPPTGEVPRLRFGDEAEDGDDMEAWRSLGSRGVRWRDEDDWDDADELDDLVEDIEPTGALDMNRAEHSDLYSFDEDFERVTSRTGSHPAVDTDDDFGAEGFDDLEEAAYARSGRGRRAKPRRGLLGRGRGRGAPSPAPAGPAGPSRAPAAPAGPVVSAPVGAGPAAGPAAAAPAASSGARTATEARPRPDRAQRPPAGRPAARSASGRGDDVGSRVAVGVALVVLLAIAYAVGAKALLALATLIIVAAAAEAYQMMRTAGFRPATLLGLVGTVGMVVAAYEKGIQALPIVTVLLIVGAMLWYVLGIVEARPLANAAVTVMVFGWVGILGAFSGVLLAMGNGKGLFLGAIATAVAADVCAFAVGRLIGSRPMAPHISPHKTWEGYAGGLVGALIVGAIIGKSVTPWGGMKHGLVLGLIVGLVCPAGDLFESMIKRDLGIKDSGSILGGHGGLLDRFDVVLLALPAAYFVATFFHL